MQKPPKTRISGFRRPCAVHLFKIRFRGVLEASRIDFKMLDISLLALSI
nr:MAG TPA: hypothetical protein [Inoviridae sp.]